MGRAFEYRKASKMKRWDKMSKLFPKLGKTITVAAKSGGVDPDMNPTLRSAIMNAKAENMPKDNIAAAIKRAMGKDAADISEITYEAKGPHGVQLFIECATDNTTRTIANLKSYINKSGGSILSNGALEFMFSRKAIFELKKNDNIDLEELELELIDYGLEEIEEEDGIILVIGDYTSFATLNEGFEKLNIELIKSNLQRICTNPHTYSKDQMIDIDKLIDKIEDDEDIQAVFTNIA